jgi:Na+-transporting NADH:ubiquinone oxidoreductase subunit NqrA
VAPITAYVDPVAFEDVSAPRGVEDLERTATTIDGLPAVRRSYESSGSGLWPDGTPITAYVIDLSPGADDAPRTMFVTAVGTAPFAPDHERHVAVLDRMAPTIRFGAP